MRVQLRQLGLIAGFIAIIGIFTLAPVASVGAEPTCTVGKVCIWQHANFGGSTLSMALPTASYCKTFPYAWSKNMMSSAFNNSTRNIAFYDGDGCTGAYLYRLDDNFYTQRVGASSNDRANSFLVLL